MARFEDKWLSPEGYLILKTFDLYLLPSYKQTPPSPKATNLLLPYFNRIFI
jgi:hypothetical protein